MNPEPASPRKTHILTIALEDYFHAPAFRGLIDQKSWSRFETRYEKSSLAALELLARSESTATFFVDAWVGQKRPDLLREILRQGHEIALSGNSWASFRSLSAGELREKLRRSRATVEDACQHEILGYRRSDVLLHPKHMAALEVLAEEGFLYDSSLTPTGFAFRREPWRRFPHQLEFGSSSIWEIPLSSYDVAGCMIPFAGGNYFRQYPEPLVQWFIRRWVSLETQPLVLYFRLWDLDPLHPRIHTGSLLRNLRHYRNSDRMVRILRELFAKYQFNSIAGTLQHTQAPVQTQSVALAASVVTTTPESRSGRVKVPISVIIPCYNEEASIPYLGRSLDELQAELAEDYDVQFILVDDGSSDKTWELLHQLFGSRTDALLIRHEHNRGVTAAISTGLEHAREIACSMDCDCSYDPRELKPMLALLTEGVDLVVASPYHPNGRVSNVPVWRVSLSRGASLLYQLVTGRRLYTFTSCLRVYRRAAAVATPLRYPGFLGVAELAGRFVLNGRVIVEHPAILELRLFGRSKMKITKTIAGHLRLLTSLAWFRITRPKAAVPPSKTAQGTPLLETAVPTPPAAPVEAPAEKQRFTQPRRRVAYVMPVYQAQADFDDTLRSLASSSMPCTVFVVDDGSRPPLEVPESSPPVDIRLIRLERNQGIVGALNAGLQAALKARFEYIARIDAGDYASPERLARQVAYLEDHPRCMLVGSDVAFCDEDGTYHFTIQPRRDPEKLRSSLHERNWLVHSSVVYRASVLREVGLYTNTYRAAEDYEMYLRIAACHEIGVVPEPLVTFVMREGGISRKHARTQAVSRLRIQLRYFRWDNWRSYYGALSTLATLVTPLWLKSVLKANVLYTQVPAKLLSGRQSVAK